MAFFFSPADHGGTTTTTTTTTFTTTFFLFQMMFCGTATTLIAGALAERTRFTTYLIISAIVAGILYPLFAHWAWEGNLAPFLSGSDVGWLQQLGFIDFAGSTVVHSLAGWVALAAIIIVGPRLGRFGEFGQFIQGHDIPQAALGMFLLWLGWLGFNGGSMMRFGTDVPMVLMHTMLAGTGGMLAALFLCWRLKGVLKPHYPINGSLAGLVAVTASANIISSADAFIIGAVGGAVMLLGMKVLERLRIDDAIGVVPVHLAAGIWGTLAVALFGDVEAFGDGVSRIDQLGIQAFGVLVCAAWAFGVGYIALSLINRIYPLRVSEADEQRGLSMSEHGASTEAFELLSHMALQQQSGDFSQHVPSQPHTEMGQIARQYNRVLDAVEARETALQAAYAKLKVSAMSYEAVRHMFDAIISTDADGNIHDVNPVACSLFGYSEKEMLGEKIEILMPERYRQAHQAGMARLRETGTSTVTGQLMELAGLRADGSEFPLEFSIENYQVDGILYFTAVMRDITARQQTEAQMAQLATVVKQADDAIIITDTDGFIQYVNPAFERLNGYAADEVIGQSPGIVKSGEHNDEYYATMWQQISSGKSWSGSFTNRAKDAHLYQVEQTISPILDSSNRVIGYASVQRDVTERNRMQEKVEHAQRLESLGVLAGGIAHDFNNLLAAIMGNAGLALHNTDEDDPRHQNLTQIHHASESAAALCKQMLAYSGQGQQLLSHINLSQAVDEMLQLLQSSMHKKTRIELQLADQLPDIEADESQIQQIIMNLVINASESLHEDSGTVVISTGIVQLDDVSISSLLGADDMQTGSFIRLSVSDSGCGMDNETRLKIFDPFFSTKFTGRGLGMSAVLGIVRNMHGGIDITSAPDQGTAFSIYFPTLEPPPETVSVPQPEPPIAEDNHLVASRDSLTATVLVVDDEDFVREMAAEILAGEDFEVLSAEDGQQGLDLFRQHCHDIDLVLLDLTMPGMHGDELYKYLRQIKPDVGVIVCSGYAEDAVMARFEADPALAFVSKPYTPDQLTDAVQSMLNKCARHPGSDQTSDQTSGQTSLEPRN